MESGKFQINIKALKDLRYFFYEMVRRSSNASGLEVPKTPLMEVGVFGQMDLKLNLNM